MRRALLAASVAALAGASLMVPALSAPGVPAVRLGLDGTAFWDGDTAAPLESSPLTPCTPLDGRCTDFAIDVAGGGHRLRVALDTPGNAGTFSLQLFDADGRSLTSTTGPYSMEAYVSRPAAGRYYARALGGAADGFRMRAKLEKDKVAARKPTATGLLLPNLELIPPYEFTFEADIAQPDLASPTAGRDPLSCNPYEMAEYAAKRCLRFSLGPQNIGNGPLMLRFEADPVTGVVGRGPVTQLIRQADGKVLERAGGSSVYHKTHAHYHHNGFGTLELLRVLDARAGKMVPAGAGPKQGFCMLDYLIPRWTEFANDPANQVRQDCGPASPTSVQLGLGVGWGDIYVYNLDGNYVEFGENTDGLYVVRSIADAFDDVLESDETDNAGYAYIKVIGNDITVLERGHGSSPWDPAKRLADDILPLNAG